jgi:DNA-binding TFAR19-related protein (PDSD5 family)
MEDKELERLKRKKMVELQRSLLKAQQPEKTEKPQSTEELLDTFFYGRAWEVYRAAKQQYPKPMEEVEKALTEAIRAGKIKGKISGEDLYTFFEELGMRVRLETTIRFKEHGELKTLEQKIKEKK